MEVYLARHGETAKNHEKRLQGQRIDESLNEQGVEHAHEVARKVQEMGLRIERIYTSRLKRAHETAEIIAQELNIPLEVLDGIEERDFGSMSGKTWQEMDEITGRNTKEEDFGLQYDYSPYDGGESVDDVRRRLSTAMDIVRSKGDEGVLFVTHGGIVRLLKYQVTGELIGDQGHTDIHALTL